MSLAVETQIGHRNFFGVKAVAACLIPLQLIFCCAAYADATESIQSDETEKSPTKIAQSIAAKPSAQTAQVISEKPSAQSTQTISEKPSAQTAQAISEKPSALIAQGTSQKPASKKPAAQAAKAASPKPPSQIAPTTAASPAPAKPSNAQDAGSLAPLGAPITLNDVNNPDVTNGLHEADKTLQLNSLYLSRSVEMNSFDALRHETSADQIITLRDAINYVLDQGMQIKISRESMNYQHWLTLSGLASFLPSFSTSFNLTRADVTNFSTTSVGKTFLAGVNYPVFQGGGVLYSMLAQRYREKAWREAYKATVSDVFLDVYQKYINLLLQRVLLQTWAKTVEADQEQLRLNNAQLSVGTGTRYAVMQTEAQLALDRQSFLQQAVAMRQAGLALNLALNCPLSINLIPAEATLSEAGIFDDNVQLKSLITDTMKFNPGLRQYENFRLSASRNIQAQAASLYPTVSFFTLYQLNNATVNPAANGFALGGAATSAIASFLDSSFAGRVSNNALGQLYGFSPTAGSTSTQGANTGPSAMPAASGGTPLYAVQSGSLVSSGAVAPSIFGGGTGSSSGPNVNGSLQAPAGIFPGFFSEFQSGFSLSWSLPSFGLTTVANLYASKLLARQALMQCNQEISLVVSQVRSDYLAVLQARQSIDKAAATAASFREALRYAKARLDNGVGTQLDIIVAQKDYVTAVTGQAQAIVASNVAQAQLLHDMGIISAETLTTGYKPGAFLQPIPTSRRKWYQP